MRNLFGAAGDKLLLLLLLFFLVSCGPEKKQALKETTSFKIFPGVEDTTAHLPAGFKQSLLVSGIASPSTMEFSPDGYLLIAERIRGRLRVLMPDGTLQSEPMLSLDIPKDENGEPVRHNSSGIRGFTFDPDYPEEPYIYLFYMKHKPRHNRVSRFRIKANDPSQVVPDSEEVLIELPFNNIGSSGSHNGGALIFGEDGKLYITTGDGWRAHGVWGGGDPVQTLETMTGKVLRINKDGSIPGDNPFYEQTSGDYRAIYALGLRNPFSMSRHPVSQQIYINDASMSDGRPEKDHILKLVKGGNYKWERPEHEQPWTRESPGIPQEPFALAGDRVITGGVWYPVQGGPFPSEYHGSYFVPLWGANDPRPGSIVRMISETNHEVETFLAVAGDGMHGMGKPVYTKIGPDGNLYWLATTYETDEGSVFKITYTGEESAGRLAMPQIEPNGGNFTHPVEIQLVAAGEDERIHYTLDGSIPNQNSPRYDAPFSVSKPVEIKVRTFKEGATPSSVASVSFDIKEDKHPPEVASAIQTRPNVLQVVFDEAVDQSSAETVSNYEVTPGIHIREARLSNDYKTVTLSTASLSRETDYTLIVRNVQDRAQPPHKITEALKTPVMRITDGHAYGIPVRQPVKPYLNMPETSNGHVPARLSLTGVFEDVFTLTPATGVIPYAINTPQWNNGAVHQYWIALPTTHDTGNGNTGERVSFTPEDTWIFPPGTVFIRHVEMTVNEKSGERKRLETQLLVGSPDGSYYGVTYKWRENGRDADLVAESRSEPLAIIQEDGAKRTQQWSINESNCMACHTAQAGYVLGVNTRQLNRPYLYSVSGVEDNQLRTWNALGMFDTRLNEQDIPTFPQMAALNDTEAPLEHRINSYFDANCAHCHRPDGVMGPQLDLRFKVDMQQKGLIGGKANNVFGVEGARAIVPGDPECSIVYQRMITEVTALRMPQFSTRIDEEAVNLLAEWIKSLKQKDAVHQHKN